MNFVYKILPYFIIRTKLLDSTWVAGISLWLVVLVKSDANEAVIKHEETHIKQQWRYTPILFALLYFASDKWRLKFEIEAYRETIKHSSITAESIARSLVKRYSIDRIGQEEIIKQLNKEGK